LTGNIFQSPKKADHLVELESGSAVGGSGKMPSSVTWDGQLSSSGVVDPWSPKPSSVPAADAWGISAAPLPQSQPSLPPPAVNDPWSAKPTSKLYELTVPMQPVAKDVVWSSVVSVCVCLSVYGSLGHNC